MSLKTRLESFAAAVGADIGQIRTGYEPKPVSAVDHARAIFSTSRRRPVSVLALGHSFVAGLASSRGNDWVNQLAFKLQASYPSGIYGLEHPTRLIAEAAASPPKLPGIAMINGGISGAYSNNYIPTGHQSNIASIQPEVVFHMIGVNDYGLGLTKAQLKGNIINSMALVDANCTVPPIHILVDQYASPIKADPVTPWPQYHDAMMEIADSNPTRYAFLSMYKLWEKVQVSGYQAPDPYDLVDADGLHPSNEGHAFFAQHIAEFLRLPPPPTPFVPDVFDRFGRSTFTGMGNALTETGQAWEIESGTWTPVATGLMCGADGQIKVPTTFSDCEVSSVVVHGGGSVLVAKSNSTSTGFRAFTAAGANDNVIVNKGASLLTWSAKQNFVVGQEYHLALSIKANNLQVMVNGKRVINHTLNAQDVTDHSGYTRHGLMGSATNSTNRFRHFAVRRL